MMSPIRTVLIVVSVIISMAVLRPVPVETQSPTIRNLEARLTALESLVTTLQTQAAGPDSPCFDNGNRYVDCGNGTVTDNVTGLIWLKQWDCLGSDTYAAANQAAAGLKDGDCSLTDKSSPGDWRLPTRAEWLATIARAVVLNCVDADLGGSGGPSLTNDAGTACYGTGVGSSFAGVASSLYWSSAAFEINPLLAFVAVLAEGNVGVGNLNKLDALRVWPVRGGPS
jgi:hypothetical protein